MGKRLGLCIAGGVLLIVLIVWLLVRAGSPTAPTTATTAPGRLDRIAMPESIWTVVERPTGPGLAADDYNKGVVAYLDIYHQDKALVRSIEKLAKTSDFADQAQRAIRSGAKRQRMGYFAGYVPTDQAVRPTHRELLGGDGDLLALPHLSAFEAMADAALSYGKQRAKSKKYRDAEGIYKAVLVFGYHVAEDRVRLRGLQIGLDIQQKAAHHLAELYGTLKKQEPLAHATKLLADLAKTIETVQRKSSETVLWMSKTGRLHAGDLRNVAANDADVLWRVEAIRQLGLCRAALSKGGGRADYRAITELLDQCRQSDEAFVQAAAKLALGMTTKDVRTAH